MTDQQNEIPTDPDADPESLNPRAGAGATSQPTGTDPGVEPDADPDADPAMLNPDDTRGS